jgi:hypothetical protein
MGSKLILFTTNCPKCKILEKKMDDKKLNFKLETDVTELIDMGFTTAPVLKIDNDYLDFGKAIKWINKQ